MTTLEIFTEEDIEPDVNATIDFLRNVRRLTPAKTYAVLTILLEEFPKGYIPVEVKKKE